MVIKYFLTKDEKKKMKDIDKEIIKVFLDGVKQTNVKFALKNAVVASGITFSSEFVSLSANKKTLTMEVKKLLLSIGVLIYSEANGETISVLVIGK